MKLCPKHTCSGQNDIQVNASYSLKMGRRHSPNNGDKVKTKIKIIWCTVRHLSHYLKQWDLHSACMTLSNTARKLTHNCLGDKIVSPCELYVNKGPHFRRLPTQPPEPLLPRREQKHSKQEASVERRKKKKKGVSSPQRKNGSAKVDHNLFVSHNRYASCKSTSRILNPHLTTTSPPPPLLSLYQKAWHWWGSWPTCSFVLWPYATSLSLPAPRELDMSWNKAATSCQLCFRLLCSTPSGLLVCFEPSVFRATSQWRVKDRGFPSSCGYFVKGIHRLSRGNAILYQK